MNRPLSIDDGGGGSRVVNRTPKRERLAVGVDGCRWEVGSLCDLDHVAIARRIDRGLDVGVVAPAVRADGDGLARVRDAVAIAVQAGVHDAISAAIDIGAAADRVRAVPAERGADERDRAVVHQADRGISEGLVVPNGAGLQVGVTVVEPHAGTEAAGHCIVSDDAALEHGAAAQEVYRVALMVSKDAVAEGRRTVEDAQAGSRGAGISVSDHQVPEDRVGPLAVRATDDPAGVAAAENRLGRAVAVVIRDPGDGDGLSVGVDRSFEVGLGRQLDEIAVTGSIDRIADRGVVARPIRTDGDRVRVKVQCTTAQDQ